LSKNSCKEVELRSELARDEDLLRQKDKVIQLQEVLSKESDHRLLNDIQMIVSLLLLQSRTSANAETAQQLAIAANRVGMIAGVHRRLRCLNGIQTVSFNEYLEDFCRDFSTMFHSDGGPTQVIIAGSVEIELPSGTAGPLGFIVHELMMNAAKFGKGQIIINLEPNGEKGYALSVSNNGPGLPDGFNPAACKGLGMKIIRSFVEQIGGELKFGPCDTKKGTRFTVLFAQGTPALKNVAER
jgi:two-component sensor histidine kinase